MAWLESHQSLGHHPKTIRAAKILGITVPTMIGHLHMLWYWAVDNAMNGDLSTYDTAVLADAAMWEGEPEAFIEALVKCRVRTDGAGFLDRAGDSLIIHDWPDYTGGLLKLREQNRERQKRFRERKSNVTHAHVTRDVTLQSAQCNVSNALTKPNLTESTESNQEIPLVRAIKNADETADDDRRYFLRSRGATADEIDWVNEEARRKGKADKPAGYLLKMIESRRSQMLNGAAPEAPPVRYINPPPAKPL